MIMKKYCDHKEILWWLKNIVMIEKYCDNEKILWWLVGIMIMKKYCDHEEILWWLKNIVMIEKYCDDWSSIVIEVIRVILNLFFFFTKNFYKHKKHKKHKNAYKRKK